MNNLSLFERFLIFYGVHCPNHPRKWWVHSQLRKLIKKPKNRNYEVKRNGLHFILNPSDYEHESLFWLGVSDTWDIHHLCTLTQENSVFFDIGSNLGNYSLNFARNKKMKCHIETFEPNPKTYELLAKHVTINNMTGVIHTNRLALSNKEGRANLIERADNSGAARLGDDASGIPVKVSTLDAFFSQSGITRLDAMKIDVEGYEIQVLQGGRETIERFKPLIIAEFWTTGLSRVGASVEELATQLTSMGYLLYVPKKDKLLPIKDLPKHDTPVNIFAIHQQSAYLDKLK